MKNAIYYLLSFAILLFGVHSIFEAQTSQDVVFGILIFTAPGGIGTAFTFNMTYLPEKIMWNDGGNPLTSLRIESQEDGVLHEWSAASIAAMNGFMNVGALPANRKSLMVCDGHLKNKNVTISGVTSAAGAIPIFVGSDNQGISAFQTKLANILPNNDTEFRKFTALFLPNLVTATDRVQIFYKAGHSQIIDPSELIDWSAMYQDTPGIIINNLPGYISYVLITSALGGLAYQLSVKV